MASMMTDRLFRRYRTVVAPEWIDVNDHMNARFYGSVIYEGHAMFTTHLGLGDDDVVTQRCGKAVVESHMVYERELRRGDEIGVVSRS
jgi:acyl-CoA thioester hydrolase